jgi:hypothetical protein
MFLPLTSGIESRISGMLPSLMIGLKPEDMPELERRRRRYRGMTKKAIRHTATPPTTPPMMAPICEGFEADLRFPTGSVREVLVGNGLEEVVMFDLG